MPYSFSELVRDPRPKAKLQHKHTRPFKMALYGALLKGPWGAADPPPYSRGAPWVPNMCFGAGFAHDRKFWTSPDEPFMRQ